VALSPLAAEPIATPNEVAAIMNFRKLSLIILPSTYIYVSLSMLG